VSTDQTTFTWFPDVLGMDLKQITTQWDNLVERLSRYGDKPQREKGDCPLLKFARFGDLRTDAGSLRHDANVVEVTGVEGDYDGEEMTPDEAQGSLERHNVKAVVLTSWSHEPDRPRWRVIAPFKKPKPPEERARFVAYLNGILGGALAPESFTLSQSYYIGARPGAEYRVLVPYDEPGEGYWIDELDEAELGAFAVYPKKNGAPPTPLEQSPPGAGLPDDIDNLLAAVSANCGHEEWLRVGFAIHDADSSEAGFDRWDAWSQTSPEKYPGRDELKRRWGSFTQTRAASRVTLGSVRHMAAENGYQREAQPSGPIDRTDTGNAELLVNLHGDHLHHIPPWRKWLAWKDSEGRWTLDHGDVHVRELAKGVGRHLKKLATKTQDGDEAKKIFSFAIRSLNSSGISGMVDLARGIPGIPWTTRNSMPTPGSWESRMA